MRTTSSFVTAFCLVGLSSVAQEMTFELSGNGGNCNGCEWTAAQGEITSDTPNKFREYLAEWSVVHHVVFNSPGGNLVSGIELGRLIREAGATTSVGATVAMDGDLSHFEETSNGMCASACAFAFMGGIDRYVSDGNLLGVHQFFSITDDGMDTQEAQLLVGLTLLHAVRMGIDPSVIVAASGTAPEDMYFFSRDELNNFGLDTSATVTESWQLEPYKGGLVLTTSYHHSKTKSVDMTIFCRTHDTTAKLLFSEVIAPTTELKAPFVRLSGTYKDTPWIRISEQNYNLGEQDIEFQRVADSRVSLAIRMPIQLLLQGAKTKFTFDPGIARVFGPLLNTSVELPSREWLSAALNNCF